MDWNQEEPEGAFCVISGSGARFFGETREEAHDAMMADAAAESRTLARFGTDFLPADVAEALPALPDGYEYLVLERMRYVANGRFNDHGYEQAPYEAIDKSKFDELSSGLKKPKFKTFEVKEATFCDGDSCEYKPPGA